MLLFYYILCNTKYLDVLLNRERILVGSNAISTA